MTETLAAPVPKTKVVPYLTAIYDVYIGRGSERHGFKASDWANPYVIGKDGTRPEVVEKFREYLYSRPDLLRRIESLRGKILGCPGCQPGDIERGECHGVVLARLADGEEQMPDLEPMDDEVALPTADHTEEALAPAVVVPEPEPEPAPKKTRRAKGSTKPKKATGPKSLYPADFAGMEPPKQLWRARRIGNLEHAQRNGKVERGLLHLPGRGSKTGTVMFLSPCTLYEETWTNWSSEPMLLKGPPGNLFFRCVRRAGFKDEDWFYTTLCKYNVPRLKPKAEDIRWNQAMLEDEIAAIKPKLIICLGKVPFDHLFKLKFKLKDIQGGFFHSEKYDCLLYPMDSIMTPLLKPEHLDRFMTDLKECKRSVDELNGIQTTRIPQQYETIETAAQLRELMVRLRALQVEGRMPWLSVDCEWAGQTAWGGLLRSFQVAWNYGQAAYVKLRDENKNYVFDVNISEVGDIIREVFTDLRTQFAGHNFAADAVWLEEHLSIPTFGRCGFDTMFAQQTINEYADLKLERMAVKYTDLGRYDLKLTMWKKESKFDEDDDTAGYGNVPDKILIPYALRDSDACLRMVPILMKQLIQQGLWRYYREIALPFTTDVFIELMRTGLPINRDYLEEMRITFTRNQEILIKEFRKDLKSEANRLMLMALCEIDKQKGAEMFQQLSAWLGQNSSPTSSEYNIALHQFKQFVGPEKLDALLPLFDHWVDADNFNVNSTDHLKRWLFDVRKFPPLKTTKKDGISMAWERVKTLPRDRQLEFTPAADKQTIKVLAAQDKLVARVEEMKSVMNIVKAFLKEPDEKGREQGLQKWIQEDERVHANFAVTETGRPRAWRPNIFNWPKAIAKPIERAFERINQMRAEEAAQDCASDGQVAEQEYNDQMQKPVSLRSAVQAPEGWAFVDMDFKTAEIVALAYVSGDENMIKVLSEPDVQFGRIDGKDPKKVLRICYNDNEGIPESEWDPKLLTPLDDPRFLRNPEGSIIHGRRDLHWELGCAVAGAPREKLDEDLFRGVGKIGNFCIAEGELVMTQRGSIPIEQVMDCDLLWDGLEWCQHAGVICNGTKQVHFYQGLWATDNHEVWDSNERKTLFGIARSSGLDLFRPASPSSEINSASSFQTVSRDSAKNKGRLLYANHRMRALWESCRKGIAQLRAGLCFEVPVSENWTQGWLWRQACLSFRNALCRHGAALQSQFTRIVAQLSRTRHTGQIQVAAGVYTLGLEEMAGLGLQRFGFRSEKQQRSLFETESETGHPGSEFVESKGYSGDPYWSCPRVSDPASRGGLYGTDGSGSAAVWHERSGVIDASPKATKIGGLEKTKTCRVYDILNVGPRHRFVCSGVMVSNSIPYGSAETNLERLVEASTGKKPKEGTGLQMIEAYKKKYPVASRFLDHMATVPSSDKGTYRSASGRVRHFFYSELEDVEGLSDYARNGLLNPLTRQARNFPIQELVAATLAKALKYFVQERNAAKKRTGLMMALYDAGVVLAPYEELKWAVDMLKDCMTKRVTWDLNGRTFHFEVDVSIALKWGVKLTPEEKEKLAPYL